MPIIRVNSKVRDLLIQISEAEVVCIDNEMYVITEKSDLLDIQTLKLESNVEDFELVFATDFHTFNWWEVSCDSEHIEGNKWKIGDSIMTFLVTKSV